MKPLTDENAKSLQSDEQTDSDENIDGNDPIQEKQKNMSAVPHPTVMHNMDGPNIYTSEIVNIAPGEGLFNLHQNQIGKLLHL